MKKFHFLFVVLALVSANGMAAGSAAVQQVGEKSQPTTNSSVADFKGPIDPEEQDFGAMMGLAIVDGQAGFALIGDIAKRIIPHGFAPDVSDAVALEAQFGPIFGYGQTTLHYSVHLRWDFFKDSAWTFYALGGVGGNYQNLSAGGRNEIFPRFGAGAFWKFFENFAMRAEISHELIAVGAAIPF